METITIQKKEASGFDKLYWLTESAYRSKDAYDRRSLQCMFVHRHNEKMVGVCSDGFRLAILENIDGFTTITNEGIYFITKRTKDFLAFNFYPKKESEYETDEPIFPQYLDIIPDKTKYRNGGVYSYTKSTPERESGIASAILAKNTGVVIDSGLAVPFLGFSALYKDGTSPILFEDSSCFAMVMPIKAPRIDKEGN